MRLAVYILFCILISSCEKETEPGILGRWQWIESCGGFAGGCFTPESSGDRISIEFRSDLTYRQFVNDTLIRTCSYEIARSTSSDGKSMEMSVKYSDGYPDQVVLYPGPDRLELVDPCCDLYDHQYKRIIPGS